MKRFIAVGALAFAALVATSALAEEALVSGLQVGKTPTPFDPLHLTGATAGEKSCLI